jgi:protein-S-isoprenylcysteine O-methyltransferase Ste14
MIPSVPQVILMLPLGTVFVYFLAAGARTFTSSGDDDVGALVAEVSFIGTGAVPALFLGMFVVPIKLANGIAAAVLLICSLALYEWARHVIWGRKFYIAWSSSVPDELVDEGPYARIRHPLYTSYMLAFLALFVAMPTLLTLLIFIANAALFTHAVFREERNLMSSALAGAYAEYKERTGMVVPRVIGGRSTKPDAK